MRSAVWVLGMLILISFALNGMRLVYLGVSEDEIATFFVGVINIGNLLGIRLLNAYLGTPPWVKSLLTLKPYSEEKSSFDKRDL